MFFRNLTLFRFPTSMKFDELDTGLGECELAPVGPLELSTRGFIPPFGRDTEALSHRQSDAIWLSVGGEDRILPGAVVNDLLQKKLAEIERKEGRKPGGRTRKRMATRRAKVSTATRLSHRRICTHNVQGSQPKACCRISAAASINTLASRARDSRGTAGREVRINGSPIGARAKSRTAYTAEGALPRVKATQLSIRSTGGAG